MLRSMHDLEGYAIGATDGPIGHVKDFYFDDQAWVIRYLVVDTGSWLSSRKVLVSPIAIGRPDWTEKILPVSITKDQVKHSPDVDTDKPVSRQYEVRYAGYYGYPNYWGGPGAWGEGFYPNMLMPGYADLGLKPRAGQSEAETIYAQAEVARHQHDDPHLRSCKAVLGYQIVATDGEIGHVRGLLVDEQTWAIRYMVVDTGNWWLGHQVLIAPQWIKGVDWHDAQVAVELTREAVRISPPYDAAAKVDRNQEIGIYKHYGRPNYWENDMTRDPEKTVNRARPGS
jgi:uncharacterized protein YrrD